MRALLYAAFGAFALTGGFPALAQSPASHQPIYLRPAAFSAPASNPLAVSFETLETLRARQAPWPEEIQWLFVRSPGFQENRSQADAPRPPDGAAALALELEHPGTTIIGVDLPGKTLLLPISALKTQVPAPPDADALVGTLVVQSAKTIVKVNGGRAGDECSVATSKSGQAVEIRPLMDPSAVPVGSDVSLRLYIAGDAAKDGAVRAIHAESGTDISLKIKPGGFCTLPLSAGGVWHVEYLCARPGPAGEDPAWTLYCATLTFQAQAAAPPPPADRRVEVPQ